MRDTDLQETKTPFEQGYLDGYSGQGRESDDPEYLEGYNRGAMSEKHHNDPID